MNKKKYRTLYSLFLIPYSLLFLTTSCHAQQDTLGLFDFSQIPNKSRVDIIKYSTIVAYPVSFYWLYTQWYKNYPQSNFHFFNDIPEWEQMDKCGHILTAYSIAKGYSGLLKWAGADSRKADWYGAGVSLLYQTTIEVFDGFSSQWGFSIGDETANVIGASAFMSQQLLWNEQRIRIKFSYHQTMYAQYRPSELGTGLSQSWLKDYNGQTYWLSVNPSMFMPADSKFPKWLSLAFGYGAEGMTGATTNPLIVNGKPIPSFDRYRQGYISLDVALDRIKTKSKFIHALADIVGILKFPAPTIEFNQGRGTRFYWLYF